MRIFNNCWEAASELKREVKEMGSEVKLQTMQDKNVEGDPDYITNELLGYTYMIADTSDKDELLTLFNKNKSWAEEEFTERVCGLRLNPGEAYKIRKELWEQYLHDGKFSYTYSERLGDQIEQVIAELKLHPSSRQGIIAMWDPKIDIDRLGKERVPCTMFYQVIIREGRLHMVYVTRSNDVMTHWAYDIWLAVKLQEYIAANLDIPVGRFYQFITSFHTYAADLEGIF